MTTPPEDQLHRARSLPVLRAMIDAIDHDLLHLLSRRNGLVAEIAQYKREHRVGIRDHDRETSLIADRRARATPLGLSPEVTESMFRLILWASRDRQAALRAEVPLDVEPRTVAVIGGARGMGACMASLFGDLGHAVMIADLDTPLTPADAASTADVVIISVPIDVTETVIADLGPRVRDDALLMDVTSIKAAPVRAMRDHSGATVLGTHPLFGPSVHSLQGQRIVLTPDLREPAPERDRVWFDWARQMFRARGLALVESSPEQHDAIMAVVQVLTHFSTEVMGRTLQQLDVSITDTLEYTSPVYLIDMLMTARHFAQSPELYASIQKNNPRRADVMRAFTDAAAELAAIAEDGDRAAFVEMFTAVHDHLGDFTDEALQRSSYLIDRLVERA